MKGELDGVTVAKVRRGREVEFEVSVGHHAVRVRQDWLTSDVVELDVEEGDYVVLAAAAGEDVMDYRSVFIQREGVLELRRIKTG
ncbi:hypothetical protein [Actinoplanes sp. M2I2]|uniref:hypothetical protein n=1 Tax=Actinoplanes sp. M2I2 TaxID=1734444 RepID=UPI0020206FC1|nr:hypothetical protein [Actinoplanes sp. M2I2]